MRIKYSHFLILNDKKGFNRSRTNILTEIFINIIIKSFQLNINNQTNNLKSIILEGFFYQIWK